MAASGSSRPCPLLTGSTVACVHHSDDLPPPFVQCPQAVEAAWMVGKDAVDAGSSLVLVACADGVGCALDHAGMILPLPGGGFLKLEEEDNMYFC